MRSTQRATSKGLRLVARILDRVRHPVRFVCEYGDRIDRALGNACWWCRFRADRLDRGEVDDGIPF